MRTRTMEIFIIILFMLSYRSVLIDSLFYASRSLQYITIDPGYTNIGAAVCDSTGIRAFRFDSSIPILKDGGTKVTHKKIERVNFLDLSNCGEILGTELFSKRVHDDDNRIAFFNVLVEKQDGRKPGFYKYENIMSSAIATLSSFALCNGCSVDSETVTVKTYKSLLGIPVYPIRKMNKDESEKAFFDVSNDEICSKYFEQNVESDSSEFQFTIRVDDYCHDTYEAFHMMIYLLYKKIIRILTRQKIYKQAPVHSTYVERVRFVLGLLNKEQCKKEIIVINDEMIY